MILYISNQKKSPIIAPRNKIAVLNFKTTLQYMATTQKKRAVVSYENMSKELAAAFAEKYPKGFSDYLPDLIKYDKPDGTCFYAVTLEIPDAIYLEFQV